MYTRKKKMEYSLHLDKPSVVSARNFTYRTKHPKNNIHFMTIPFFTLKFYVPNFSSLLIRSK